MWERERKKRNRNLQLYLLIIVSLWLQCANISICHFGFLTVSPPTAVHMIIDTPGTTGAAVLNSVHWAILRGRKWSAHDARVHSRRHPHKQSISLEASDYRVVLCTALRKSGLKGIADVKTPEYNVQGRNRNPSPVHTHNHKHTQVLFIHTAHTLGAPPKTSMTIPLPISYEGSVYSYRSQTDWPRLWSRLVRRSERTHDHSDDITGRHEPPEPLQRLLAWILYVPGTLECNTTLPKDIHSFDVCFDDEISHSIWSSSSSYSSNHSVTHLFCIEVSALWLSLSVSLHLKNSCW